MKNPINNIDPNGMSDFTYTDGTIENINDGFDYQYMQAGAADGMPVWDIVPGTSAASFVNLMTPNKDYSLGQMKGITDFADQFLAWTPLAIISGATSLGFSIAKYSFDISQKNLKTPEFLLDVFKEGMLEGRSLLLHKISLPEKTTRTFENIYQNM